MLAQERIDEIMKALERAPCIESLRLRLLEAEEGYCRLSAPRDPLFDGLAPGFHGGMQAMVADCVAWFAIATAIGPHEPLATTSLQVQYLAPCLGDAVAEGRLIKLGKTLAVTEVRLFDDSGVQVAHAIVTYFRLSPRR
jgi:uncharacterized protein (TIGR00369 family)